MSTEALERERTKRMFIQTLGSVFGVDQSYAETDAVPINQPGQYQVYGPTFGYAEEGQPASQAQESQGFAPLLLILVGGLILWKLAG